MFEHDGYSIDYSAGKELVSLRGVMRLPTPAAFERVFEPLTTRVDRGESVHIDLCALSFMNSSGIRALATLVLKAKQHGAQMRLIGCATVPWQKKTLASLSAINREIEIEMR
jgi:anti-anti-sigma factor